MDSVKSTANVAGFVHRFTKVLKFRAIGIAPDRSSSENGSDSAIRSEKIIRQIINHQKPHSQEFSHQNDNHQKLHSQNFPQQNDDNQKIHSQNFQPQNGHHQRAHSQNFALQNGNQQRAHSQNSAMQNGFHQRVHSQSSEDKNNQSSHNREAMEALFARLFASISSLKAAYAQLQIAHTPYDPENIQLADKIVVSELKNLSELKHLYLKNRGVVPSLQESQLSAEIIEQQSLIKTYEIMVRKFQSQIQVKDSEIISLREQLQEANEKNESLEKRLNPRGFKVLSEHFQLSELNPNHFTTVVQSTSRALRNFTKLMIDKMISAGWDLDLATASIEPHVIYAKPKHKRFAFEAFVCQKMFNGFQHERFCSPNEPEPEPQQRPQQQRHKFFSIFMELKSEEPIEFLNNWPDSSFGRFCRSKYLQTIHPKMELSLFGDLDHRNLVNSGGIPATTFYAGFSEMAKWVWLLHCLAFSFDPRILIFQVRKGSQFSEVYTESVIRDMVLSDELQEGRPQVGFTVFPGFKVGKTILQCQVYLSGMKSVEDD